MNQPTSCCKDFPDECKECSEYEEIYPTLNVAFTGCFGIYAGPSYIIKKCKRFKWQTSERC